MAESLGLGAKVRRGTSSVFRKGVNTFDMYGGSMRNSAALHERSFAGACLSIVFYGVFAALVCVALFKLLTATDNRVLVEGKAITTQFSLTPASAWTTFMDVPCLDVDLDLEVLHYHTNGSSRVWGGPGPWNNTDADPDAVRTLSGRGPIQAIEIIDNTAADISQRSTVKVADLGRAAVAHTEQAVAVTTRPWTAADAGLTSTSLGQDGCGGAASIFPINQAMSITQDTSTSFVPHTARGIVAFPHPFLVKLRPFMLQAFMVNRGEANALTNLTQPFSVHPKVVDEAVVGARLGTFDRMEWTKDYFGSQYEVPTSWRVRSLADSITLAGSLQTSTFPTREMVVDPTHPAPMWLRQRFPGVAAELIVGHPPTWPEMAYRGIDALSFTKHYTEEDIAAFMSGLAYGSGPEGVAADTNPFLDWALAIHYRQSTKAVSMTDTCDGVERGSLVNVIDPFRYFFTDFINDTATTIVFDCSDPQSMMDVRGAGGCLDIINFMNLEGVTSIEYDLNAVTYMGVSAEVALITHYRMVNDPQDQPPRLEATLFRPDPVDHEAAAVIHDHYPLTPPGDWTCDASWWRDGECDCNCGTFDPDCITDLHPNTCADHQICSQSGTCIDSSTREGMYMSTACTSAFPKGTVSYGWIGALRDVLPTFKQSTRFTRVCPMDYLSQYLPTLHNNVLMCNIPRRSRVFAAEVSNSNDEWPDQCTFPEPAFDDDGVYILADAGVDPGYLPADVDVLDLTPDEFLNTEDQLRMKINSGLWGAAAVDGIFTNYTTVGEVQDGVLVQQCLYVNQTNTPLLFEQSMVFGSLGAIDQTTAVIAINSTDNIDGDTCSAMVGAEYPLRIVTGEDGLTHSVVASFTSACIEVGDHVFFLVHLTPTASTLRQYGSPAFIAIDAVTPDLKGGMVDPDTGFRAVPPDPGSAEAAVATGEWAPWAVHISGADETIQVVNLAPPPARTSAERYMSAVCQCDVAPARNYYSPACTVPTAATPWAVNSSQHEDLLTDIYICQWTPPSTFEPYFYTDFDIIGPIGSSPPTYTLTATEDFPLWRPVHPGDRLIPLNGLWDTPAPLGMVAQFMYTVEATVSAEPVAADVANQIGSVAESVTTAGSLLYTIPDGQPLDPAELCPNRTLSPGAAGGHLSRHASTAPCSMTAFMPGPIADVCSGGVGERFSDAGLPFAPVTGSLSVNHTIPLTNRLTDALPDGMGSANRIDRTAVFAYSFTTDDLETELDFATAHPDARYMDGAGRNVTARYSFSYDALGIAARPCTLGRYSDLTGVACSPSDAPYDCLMKLDPLTMDRPAPFPQVRVTAAVKANREATQAVIDAVGRLPQGWGSRKVLGLDISRLSPVRRLLVWWYGSLDRVTDMAAEELAFNLDAALGDALAGKLQLVPGREVVLDATVRVTPYYTGGVMGNLDVDHWEVTASTTATWYPLLPELATESRVRVKVAIDTSVKQMIMKVNYSFAVFLGDVGAAFALTSAGLVALDQYKGIKESVVGTVSGLVRKIRGRRDDEEEPLDELDGTVMNPIRLMPQGVGAARV